MSVAIAHRVGKEWEAHHPSLLSALAFGGMLWKGPAAYAYAAEHSWKVDQAYTCVFTLATVFTAFLFTFYTFVVTAERGFLARARASTYFKQMVGYTFSAIAVGAILCVVTIPMLVVQPVPSSGDPWLAVAAVWLGLTVWSGASFIRAAYLFAIFAGSQNGSR
jgi:hypothetical protein